MIGIAEMRRAAVYERLAVLENAGIPLREGVAQVATQGGEGALALGEVLRRLNAGSDVAGAFLDAPAISDFEAQMIRAGERAGRLPEAFQELGRFFEGVAKTKRQLAGELAYPVFVAHLAMVIPSIPLLVLGGPEEFLWAVLGPLATVYGLGGAVWVGGGGGGGVEGRAGAGAWGGGPGHVVGAVAGASVGEARVGAVAAGVEGVPEQRGGDLGVVGDGGGGVSES